MSRRREKLSSLQTGVRLKRGVALWTVLATISGGLSGCGKRPDDPKTPAIKTAPTTPPAASLAHQATSRKPLNSGTKASWQAEIGTSLGPLVMQLPGAVTRTVELAETATVVAALERRIGLARSGSALQALERRAGDGAPVKLPPDVRWLLEGALRVTHKTQGAWQVTTDTKRTFGTPTLVLQRRDSTGRLLRKGVRLALQPVAIGYLLQLVGEKLQMMGHRQFQLRLAGQWLVASDGEDRWTVPIASGRSTDELYATLTLDNAAVGRCGGANLLSASPDARAIAATVVGDAPTFAAAIACALVELGPVTGLRALAEFPGMEAVIVAPDGTLSASPSLRQRLHAKQVAGP